MIDETCPRFFHIKFIFNSIPPGKRRRYRRSCTLIWIMVGCDASGGRVWKQRTLPSGETVPLSGAGHVKNIYTGTTPRKFNNRYCTRVHIRDSRPNYINYADGSTVVRTGCMVKIFLSNAGKWIFNAWGS